MASMDADVVDKRMAYHIGSNQSDTDHTAQICLVSYECAKIAQIRCRDPPALAQGMPRGILGEAMAFSGGSYWANAEGWA
jgi:hypothetical protein